jgi:Fe-S-cluster containining protein
MQPERLSCPPAGLDRRYFFRDGLRFECQRCGACCTGAPGLVWADRAETAAIRRWMEETGAAAEGVFTPLGDGFRIREAPDGRCGFFEAGCRIYPLRPTQCRIYPFWTANLRSACRWREEARQCPGIGRGRRYDLEEILACLAVDRPPNLYTL